GLANFGIETLAYSGHTRSDPIKRRPHDRPHPRAGRPPIDAILARGADLDCRPLSVIVVEPGCKVKAFKKEDGSSMIRFEMAYGKAYAALAMGRSSKLVKVRAEEKPIFMRYLIAATDEQIFPEGGGLQIRDAAGEVIGAVGVTGDTEERDEELAAHG